MANSPRYYVPPAFNRALALLVPNNNHRALRAVFDNRVTVRAIRHWRKGRRRIPQWARDCLTQRLAPIAELPAQINDAPPPWIPGTGLREYRARKLRGEI